MERQEYLNNKDDQYQPHGVHVNGLLMPAPWLWREITAGVQPDDLPPLCGLLRKPGGGIRGV